MTLEHVVPWGRNLQEYETMFLLKGSDLKKKILGCSDGPSSFNKELTGQGGNVRSIDPVYEFSKDQIKQRIDETAALIIDQVTQTKEHFVWSTIGSIEELKNIRMSAMEDFLKDFDQGKEERRYVTGALPSLPCENREFDLALCSHFLFLYSDHFDLDFHKDAVLELCRVSKEVRIFPLIDLKGKRSPHLDAVLEALDGKQYQWTIEVSHYEFQKGGNEMLKIICS